MARFVTPSGEIAPRRGPTALLLGLALTLGTALPAAAAETGAGGEFITTLESVRGMGMGGANTALAEGSDAFIYNPAGLMQNDYWKVEARAWNEDSENEPADHFNTLNDLAGANVLDIAAYLSKDGQKTYSRRSQALVSYHNETGFGLAAFDSTQLQSVPDPATGGIRVRHERLQGGMLTLAWQSEFKMMLFGVSLKGMTREIRERQVTPLVVADADFEIPGEVNTGNGYAGDVGLMLRLPIPFLRPTLGVAALNLGEPTFDLEDEEPLRAETNVGLTFFPNILAEHMRLVLSFDLRDQGRSRFPDDDSERKRLHMGAEIALFPLDSGVWGLELRGGQSQGYVTYGVALNLSHYLSVSMARYKEEIGTEDDPDPQSRLALEASLGF